MEGTKTKARVVCNPASGGGYDPDDVNKELCGMLSLAPSAFASSDYMEKDGVFHTKAKKRRVETSPGGLSFDADGKLLGKEPIEFEDIPGALRVVVGERYVAEPER